VKGFDNLIEEFLKDCKKIARAVITAGLIGYIFQQPHYLEAIVVGSIWWIVALTLTVIDSSYRKNYPDK